MKIVLVFLICALLVMVFPKKYVMVAFFLNSIAIAWLAYTLSTVNQYDLVYHLDLYDNMSGKGLEYVFSHFYFKQSPLYVLYVYCLGFLKNKHLLPAVSTFIGYFSFASILNYFIKKEDFSKIKYVAIYFFILCTLPWHDFSAGIRGALAFTLCSLAVFFDLVKGKSKLGLIIYVLAIFVHQSAIIALFTRLVLFFTKKLNKKGSFGLVCVCMLLFSVLSGAVSQVLILLANGTGLSIINVIAHSFEAYIIGGTDLYEYSVVIIRAMTIVVVLFIIYMCGIRMGNEYDRKCSIIRYYLLFICLTFSYIGQYDIFCRYSVASILLSSMVLSCCGDAPITFKLGNIFDRSYGFVLVSFSTLVLICYYVIYYSKWVFGG